MTDQAASSLHQRDGHLVNHWYIACLSGELRANKPLARTIYDQRLVLFRNAQGQATCLPDRCLHRHAPLSLGKICAGQLQCPYHGWTYDGQGQVTHIPAGGPGAAAAAFTLKALPTHEQDGCIWVWMGASEVLSPAPPWRFPFHEQPGWLGYYMVTDFDNEVTNLVENFMDVPHTVFVHHGWFRRRALKKIPITITTDAETVLVTYQQSSDSIGFFSRILNPTDAPMRHTDLFVMPNLTRVDYWFGDDRAFLITSQCTPVSTLRSRVYTQINIRLGIASPLLLPFLRFYTRQVINQDVRIMAAQAVNLRHDLHKPSHSTAADHLHLAIESLRQRGAKATTNAAPSGQELKTLERSIWV